MILFNQFGKSSYLSSTSCHQQSTVMHKHCLSLLCEPFKSVTIFLVDFQSEDKWSFLDKYVSTFYAMTYRIVQF